ncbi:MAG: cation:proton antiporter [Kiritimatiellales bacterium]|nr:cation:proton antiporter [Kiritimatiellales bacterium]
MPFTDPVLVFATVMVLILLSPIVARRLRLPDIVGLIVAGMVFGDHGLGMLARDDTMKLLGQVGLLFIMFLAGLEIDLHQVRRQRSHSIIFGILTFAVPLAMGTLLGQWILGMAFPTALLMSTMFSSHTLLTFPVAGRLGLTKSRSATTTIGGTIITDTLALLTLAVIVAGTKGNLTTYFWIVLAAKIAVYMGGVIFLAPLVGKWFLRRFSADENLDFIAVLAIAFTVSYLAHVAGLEPIIGAFMAGLTLNSLIPERGALMGKLHFVGNALFIPFFLLSVGMLVNIELLWQGVAAWKIIGIMVPVALAAKWIAAQVFGKVMRYSDEETGFIYGLSVNHAAATLAAAMVGYEIGLFDDGVITGTIAMIGVTCFAGPIITEKFGRALATKSRQHVIEVSTVPHRVMIPVHSMAKDKEVLDLAFFLRLETSQEPLYPVNVVFEGPRAESEIAESEKLLDHLVMRSLAVDVPITPMVVVDTNIASGILRAAREKRISIISVPWDGEIHGRPRIFGRTIDRLIEGSSQLVLVSRIGQPLATTQRILLVCPPLSNLLTGAAEAVSIVKTVARQSGSKIILMVPDDSLESFKELGDKCKPRVTLEYQSYANGKTIEESIAATVKADDWVIVLASRMGKIAWQPRLDRFPRILVTQLAEHNLSFIYPPSEVPEQQSLMEGQIDEDIAGQILEPDHCLFQVDDTKINTILEKLLTPVFKGRYLSVRPAIDALTDIARSEPVELVSGLVLLHDHCPDLDTSEIFMATSAQPLDFPQVEGSVRIVLVLLDPAEQKPTEHLAALNNIAKLIKLPNFIEQVLKASSYEELLRGIAADKDMG